LIHVRIEQRLARIEVSRRAEVDYVCIGDRRLNRVHGLDSAVQLLRHRFRELLTVSLSWAVDAHLVQRLDGLEHGDDLRRCLPAGADEAHDASALRRQVATGDASDRPDAQGVEDAVVHQGQQLARDAVEEQEGAGVGRVAKHPHAGIQVVSGREADANPLEFTGYSIRHVVLTQPSFALSNDCRLDSRERTLHGVEVRAQGREVAGGQDDCFSHGAAILHRSGGA